jgi:hypothetical protein
MQRAWKPFFACAPRATFSTFIRDSISPRTHKESLPSSEVTIGPNSLVALLCTVRGFLLLAQQVIENQALFEDLGWISTQSCANPTETVVAEVPGVRVNDDAEVEVESRAS